MSATLEFSLCSWEILIGTTSSRVWGIVSSERDILNMQVLLLMYLKFTIGNLKSSPLSCFVSKEKSLSTYMYEICLAVYMVFFLFQDQWDICEQQNHQAYSVTGQSYFVC